MSQQQSPMPNQVLLEVKQTTKKLDQTTAKFEEATKLRQAMDQADLLDRRKMKEHGEVVKKAMNEQKEAAKMLGEALKNASTNVQLNDVQKRELSVMKEEAITSLTRVPALVYDKKKMRWVVISLGIVFAIVVVLVVMSPSGKFTVTIGLIIAALGQLVESLKKASDVKANPRLEDGFSLVGEGIKFLGALTVLFGAVTGF